MYLLHHLPITTSSNTIPITSLSYSGNPELYHRLRLSIVIPLPSSYSSTPLRPTTADSQAQTTTSSSNLTQSVVVALQFFFWIQNPKSLQCNQVRSIHHRFQKRTQLSPLLDLTYFRLQLGL